MFGHIDNIEHLRSGSVLVILEMMFPEDHGDEVIPDAVGGSENMSGGDQSSSTEVGYVILTVILVSQGCNPGMSVEFGGDTTHHSEYWSDSWTEISVNDRHTFEVYLELGDHSHLPDQEPPRVDTCPWYTCPPVCGHQHSLVLHCWGAGCHKS